MKTIEILKKLIALPTISADSNIKLIDYCSDQLIKVGAEVKIIKNNNGTKANLFATVGPRNIPGVLLSGHTDVVPVAGQSWTVPAFEMTKKNNKIYGRGTADMKSFLACALHTALKASHMNLTTPLHLALSYDEEIGCVGVRSMIEMLKKSPFIPLFCIVGEPTLMQIATGNKGKVNVSVKLKGKEAHSALSTSGLNAIYLASEMINEIRLIQDEIKKQFAHDDEYEIPHTTLHVGKIEGGVALNIVPNSASFLFEIRNLPEDDPNIILTKIRKSAESILTKYLKDFPTAKIHIEVTNQYPSLRTSKNSDVVNLLKSLTGNNSTFKVSFGTEGGLFSNELQIPTAICGPGSMSQGHKPDEYVSIDQINKCEEILSQLLLKLQAGL
tara:strand:+ start:322 stop:1476 length:1155 start_codon:yes stop_codon:yes gene_type:complete